MMSRKTTTRGFIPTWYHVTSQSDAFSIFAGLSSKIFPPLIWQQKRFQAFETATYFDFPDGFEVNTLQMQLIETHIE